MARSTPVGLPAKCLVGCRATLIEARSAKTPTRTWIGDWFTSVANSSLATELPLVGSVVQRVRKLDNLVHYSISSADAKLRTLASSTSRKAHYYSRYGVKQEELKKEWICLSPVAFQAGAPAVRAFRRLVQEHLPRLQAHGVPQAVVAFDFDGPLLVVVVVGVVDVKDGRHHVGVHPVGVERQGRAAAVNPHPVRRDGLQRPGRGRPLLRGGTEGGGGQES